MEGEEQSSYFSRCFKSLYSYFTGSSNAIVDNSVVDKEGTHSSRVEQSAKEDLPICDDHQITTEYSGSDEITNEDLVEVTKEGERWICQYYMKGRCRFGTECRFLHPAGVKQRSSPKTSPKQKKKQAKPSATKKKRSMKTALDVIKRIQWDEMLPPEFFKVGYVDRFVGVVEEPFSKFSNWGDLAGAEHDALAIPQHRIQYFKYKTTKVWDKNEKIDEVFGSTGSEIGIEAFMERVDEEIKRDIAEGAYEEEEEDSSDDDDIEIAIGAPSNNVHLIPDEERSTHFLAFRITSPEVIESARRLQKHIVDQEEVLGECCMRLGLFHVTHSMMRLSGPEGVQEATRLVEDLRPQLQEILDRHNGIRIRLAGLETFGQRVLFAKVHPDPDEGFWEFVSTVRDAVAKSSDAISVTNKFELMPHMTVMKVSRPIQRIRNSKYLPSRLYEDFKDMEFGVQKLDNLQLCVIETSTRDDGFYRTLSELKFE